MCIAKTIYICCIMQGEKNVAPEEKKPKEVAAAKKTKDKQKPKHFFQIPFRLSNMSNDGEWSWQLQQIVRRWPKTPRRRKRRPKTPRCRRHPENMIPEM